MTRRLHGGETIDQLRSWDGGQAQTERLANAVLRLDGHRPIPVHPTGGPDGGKDLHWIEKGVKHIAAVYFSADQNFSTLVRKFKKDLDAACSNGAEKFLFVTNQKTTNTNRRKLAQIGTDKGIDVEIYDRERIRGILDAPEGYGVRFEFLSIEMTRDEQISFFHAMQEQPRRLVNALFHGLKMSVQHVTCCLSRDSEAVEVQITPVDICSTFVICTPSDSVCAVLTGDDKVVVRRHPWRSQQEIECTVQVVEHAPSTAFEPLPLQQSTREV